MSLTKTGYKKRVIDDKIKGLVKTFGAVSIVGPKWCGKTWTALRHANSVTYLMDPADNYSNRTRALLNPTLILQGKQPQLIDEWQEVPAIWDAVRFAVDQTPEAGQFLLTGSATPPKTAPLHSGAGRFARIKMMPMTLFESGDSTGKVSLEALFNDEKFAPSNADISLEDLIFLTARGGWPVNIGNYSKESLQIPFQYIDSVIANESFASDNPRRNPAKLKLLLRSLARNNTTIMKDSTIYADMTNDKEESISRQNIAVYLDDLMKIFLIEEIPGWAPLLRSKTRIRMSPKKIFVDPSLAIAALGATPQKLLKDLNTFGLMFEGLCLRDLSVYAEVLNGSLYHYRDNAGLEVDAIIEIPGTDYGAFEIKLGAHRVEEGAKTLTRFRKKMTEAGAEAPKFLAVITGGGTAYIREDGIAVIPINSLRP
ncbi:ATPase [Spirochaetia bacterium]|nr:ATPase [Spirochaetia bacterium]